MRRLRSFSISEVSVVDAEIKSDSHLPSGLADFDRTSSFLSTSRGSVFFRPLDATNSLIFLSRTSSVMFSSTCQEAVLRTSVSSFDLKCRMVGS